jgi:hypothetical protein
MPGLTSFILNGVLFLVGAFFIYLSISYIVSIVKYKPLSEEEHAANQARIAQRDALKKELNEYSDLMIEKLDIIKQQFVEKEYPFREKLTEFIGEEHRVFSAGEVYDFFNFLNKYYKKMRR